MANSSEKDHFNRRQHWYLVDHISYIWFASHVPDRVGCSLYVDESRTRAARLLVAGCWDQVLSYMHVHSPIEIIKDGTRGRSGV